MLTKDYKKIIKLKQQFDSLSEGKDALLRIIFEAELPESIYNSNAIENSTLTISETEQILMQMEVSRDVSVREVFEAKNLARVCEYIQSSVDTLKIGRDSVLLLHQMLIGVIDDSIAGRFRQEGEFVRIGTHIAPAPEHVESMLGKIFTAYDGGVDNIVAKVARFHLDFETVHPFNDGNGRIGRVLINLQLLQAGFPPIIIRDKEKGAYYTAFDSYRKNDDIKDMTSVIYLALSESLHKRIAYLASQKITPLTQCAQEMGESKNALLNKARRQTVPAFREKGVWKIGVSNN